MITGAIAKLILTEAGALAVSIRNRLAAYGNGKAVFTTSLPYELDGNLPAILITDVSAAPFGTRGNPGGNFTIDIQVFGPKDMTRAAIWSLAEDLWLLINRANLAPYLSGKGWLDCGLDAPPPINTQDGLGFPGYTIRASLLAIRA